LFVCTVKLGGYFVLGKLLAEQLEKTSALIFSLRRCCVGLFFDAIYCAVVWLLFEYNYLPITKGHVGVPIEYVLIPALSIIPRIMSGVLTLRVFHEIKSGGVLFGASLLTYFLDYTILAVCFYYTFGSAYKLLPPA
jgi:hypothetical protein